MNGSEHTHFDASSVHCWIGRMGVVCGESARMIEHDPKAARRYLQATLAEFIASPVPAEETRKALRPYLGGKR